MVVENDQVTAHDVESLEVLICSFGVKDVLVDDECCSFGVVGVPHTDLADRSIFPENVVHLLWCDLERQVAKIGVREGRCE